MKAPGLVHMAAVYNGLLARPPDELPPSRRHPSLLPLVAPILALLAALIAPSWYALLAAAVISIVDPGTARVMLRFVAPRSFGALRARFALYWPVIELH